MGVVDDCPAGKLMAARAVCRCWWIRGLKADDIEMNVTWRDPASFVDQGFAGFRSVGDLRLAPHAIPATRGVYFVVRTSTSDPEYLAVGSGGHFKGRDPNVSIEVLRANWVRGASVVYIGKAGDPGSASHLRRRLTQYLRFGEGAPVGHWGGRYIWQLPDANELLLCWRSLPDASPSAVETELIADFRATYGQRPFANLVK